MIDLAAIANALGKPRKTEDGYLCLCPIHEKATSNPSLSLTINPSGELIVNCFAHCDWKAIKEEIKKKGFTVESTDRKERRDLLATFYYTDEKDETVFRKLKFSDGSYVCQSPNGVGWKPSVKHIEKKPLFNLPKILAAIREGKPVAIFEGEKDAINFTEATGIAATTCWSGGVSWNDADSPLFKGANVLLGYDNDDTGIKRRDKTYNSIKPYAASIELLQVPPPYKDFSEWAEKNEVSTWESLKKTSGAIGTDFSPIQPPPAKSLYVATDALDFIKKDIPIRRHIQGPFVVGSLNLVSAPTGVGKTWFSMGLAYSIALGTSFLQWENELRQKVLYIDGELPSHLIKERLLLFSRFNGNKLPDPGYFRLITPDEQNAEMPDIGMPEGRAALEPIIKESDFIVFDNLSTLMRSGGKENESESFQKIQTWLIHVIRKNQKSALLVHHTGKDPERGPRGSVSKEDALDTSLMLKRPEGANPDDGVNFEITFRKKRFYRKNTSDGNPIRVTFNEDFGWGYEPLEDARLTAIKELLANGVPKKDIAAEIGVSKATAYRLMDQLNKAETDSETTSETRKKPKNYLEKEQDEYY